MNIKLPEVQTDLLKGHHPAQMIAEKSVIAYWMHGRDDDTALYHYKSVHEYLHELADALGYTLTPKDQ